MAISVVNLGTGGGTATTGTPWTYTTSSFTFTSGRHYLMAVAINNAGNAVSIASISGGGVTWSYVTLATAVTTRPLELWRGECTSTTTGTLVISGGQNSVTPLCTYVIDEVTGHDSSGIIVQSKVTSNDGVSPAAVTFSAYGNSRNRPWTAALNSSTSPSSTLTQPSGYTVLSNVQTSTAVGRIRTAWKSSVDTACSWTGSGSSDSYGIVGVELKAGPATIELGASYANTVGSGGTSDALTTAASGSTFVVALVFYNDQTSVSIADSKSNTYTHIGSLTASGSGAGSVDLWYCQNGTGGSSHTWTPTFDGFNPCLVLVVEVLGAATSGVLDQTTAWLYDASSPFTSNTTGTTSQAAEMALAFTFTGATTGDTLTWGNGFTQIGALSDGFCSGASAYKILSSTGTVQSSITATVATWATSIVITLKQDGGGGSIAIPNGLMLLGVGS